jgi:hypothetical protein
VVLLVTTPTKAVEYEALDWLMIRYAIPLINLITRKRFFAKKMIRYDWKYKPVSCKLDMLLELPKSFNKRTYDIKKVALFKEMIRASYANPLEIKNDYRLFKYAPEHFDAVVEFTNPEIIEKSENLAKFSFDNRAEYSWGNMIYKITYCPVCGLNSLLVYEDFFNMKTEEKYNYKVKCTCCSFELNNEIDVLTDPTLKIENFWERSPK